jgi:pantetheine-phosphate adenylyltransferase
MSEKVILPGSYDPITVGHLDIIKEAAASYGEVYVVAFVNPDKEYLFSPDERLEMLRIATEGIPEVRVDFSDGLVIDYMKQKGITKILKGFRNSTDLEYEERMAEWNRDNGGVDTVFLKCKEKYSSVSSTAVRGALAEGRLPIELLPDGVREFIANKLL